MHRFVRVVAAIAAILVLPSLVFAQATIAGVIRDASAAVLRASASRRPVPYSLKRTGQSSATAPDSTGLPICRRHL